MEMRTSAPKPVTKMNKNNLRASESALSDKFLDKIQIIATSGLRAAADFQRCLDRRNRPHPVSMADPVLVRVAGTLFLAARALDEQFLTTDRNGVGHFLDKFLTVGRIRPSVRGIGALQPPGFVQGGFDKRICALEATL